MDLFGVVAFVAAVVFVVKTGLEFADSLESPSCSAALDVPSASAPSCGGKQ